MRLTIDLRPEVVNAIDAKRRETGGTREGVCVDIIEAVLGLTQAEYGSMTQMGNGYGPLVAEGKLWQG
jgi:hypothetical protein